MIHSTNSKTNHTFRCWKEYRTGVYKKKFRSKTNTEKKDQHSTKKKRKKKKTVDAIINIQSAENLETGKES